jgi:hypothetical protein
MSNEDLASVMDMLDRKNVNDLAYKYLDSEQTEGQTTKSEKAHFVQGFLQACSMIREKLDK